MSRKPKTNRVPRTRAGNTWTEAAFWGFIRSGFRRMSLRWPPRKQALLSARRKSQSSNKRLKWEVQCAECLEWFPQYMVEVDHIEPCGQLRSSCDVGPFVERLFCEQDGFQCLCKPCNNKKKDKHRDLRKQQQRIPLSESGKA